MDKPSKFTLALLGVIVFTGILVSGYFAFINLGLPPLIVFSLKAFLLGLCTGAVALESPIDKKEQPIGLWFISGFGVVMVVFSVLIVTGLLAITTVFVFLFGFLVVYSESFVSIYDDPRTMIENLSWFSIFGAFSIAIVFLFGFDDDIIALLESVFP